MCPSGCGPLYKPGIDLRDTTCPCGFGYFDRSGLFVAGDHVRSGQAVSRESHATHPRSCPLEADPRNRNTESEFSDAGGQSGGFRDYFMPGTGIDLEMLKIYVARDGPMGTVRPTEFHGQSGYLIHAKQMPTVEYISNIKADSTQILKLRRKYGSRMPDWAPVDLEPGLQVRKSRGIRQNPSDSMATPEDRHANTESSQQSVIVDQREPIAIANRSPFHTGYERTYPGGEQQPRLRSPSYPSPDTLHSTSQSQYADFPERRSLSEQQTSLADRFRQFSLSQQPDSDLYSTATQSSRERSILSDSRQSVRNFSSQSSHSTVDPSAGLVGTGGRFSRAVPMYDRQENKIIYETQGSLIEPPYQPISEPQRPSTLPTTDPSRAPSQDASRTQDSRTGQARDERVERNRITARTYTDSRDQRTVVTPGVRRTDTDPRDPHLSRSTRRGRLSVEQPPDEDEEPSKRPAKRDSRR